MITDIAQGLNSNHNPQIIKFNVQCSKFKVNSSKSNVPLVSLSFEIKIVTLQPNYYIIRY